MARKKKTNGTGRTPIYKSYVFRDKEPVIDELRTIIEDVYGARLTRKMLREIHQAGGPSDACMAGWFFGTTKRPQSVTIEAAGRSIGFKRVWQKMK